MGKGKKGGKRMTKKQLADVLTSFFTTQPNDTFTFKQIFRALHIDTHPLKMLALDIMEEMAWDDILSKVDDHSYRLNTKGQVQEGVFRRKANGKNSFLPDDGGNPCLWQSATRCLPSTATGCVCRSWRAVATISKRRW